MIFLRSTPPAQPTVLLLLTLLPFVPVGKYSSFELPPNLKPLLHPAPVVDIMGTMIARKHGSNRSEGRARRRKA